MDLHTIEEMIVNLAIVTAFSFITSQVIFRKRNLDGNLPFIVKIKIGLLTGLLGVLLMLFTVTFHDTILDFRQVAIILSALVGGFVPAILTGLIIGAMRLLAFGSINTNTLIAALNTIAISFGVGIVCSTIFSYWKKWIYALLICNAMTSIVFFLLFGWNGFTPAVLYIVMFTFGGLFTAFLTRFLAKAKSYSMKMEKEATIDFLTGLNNHRTFDMVFNKSLAHAIEHREHLTLVLVDIDHFKKVNDTHGHPNGDCLLKQLGELLKRMSSGLDSISRIGGEEFSILLYGLSHQEALMIAERTRLAVQDHRFVLNDGTQIQITVSMGVESLSEQNDNDLIEQADRSLYKAKTDGRNQVCSNAVA